MSLTAPVRKIAIVGASGRIGGHMARALLEKGNHTVTAITRPDSKGELPAGVNIVKASYDDEESLVSALRGQQFLVITLSVSAPKDTHSKLVTAATNAGVPYIMPNVYGPDFESQSLREDDMVSMTSLERCQEIQALGSSYVAMVCGFWYEWSLALGEFWFGISIKERKAIFFDDGNTRINVSTWEQCGRALASLLSLPESGATPNLRQWRNKPLYIASFKVSQRDMLDSLHRVMGTTDKDWKIEYVPSPQRYKEGVQEMKDGKFMSGLGKSMYTRNMFPNGDGDFESSRGLANEILGLPKEDLDACTKKAVQMVESGWNPFA